MSVQSEVQSTVYVGTYSARGQRSPLPHQQNTLIWFRNQIQKKIADVATHTMTFDPERCTYQHIQLTYTIDCTSLRTPRAQLQEIYGW